MDLRQLRHFLAVAEDGSFSRAAMRLNISQPPLSRSVRDLEATLGVELFTRTTRKVQLTSAGRVFQTKARTVVFEAEAAVREVQRLAAGCSDVINIGFMSSVMLAELTPVLQTFYSRVPTVYLRFLQMRSDEQLAALIDDRIDVGFVDLGVQFLGSRFKEGAIRADLFLHEELCVAVCNGNPLAKRTSIELQELRHETFGIVERHLFPAHYDTVIAACRRAGYAPHIGYHADQIPTVLAYAASGMGICLSPLCAKPAWSKYLTFVRLKKPVFIDVHMITKIAPSMKSVTQLRETLIAHSAGAKSAA